MNIAKHPIVSLGMVVVLSFVVRLPFIPRPFEPDEPCYALVAQEVLRGVPIYKGIADAKPPGLHFLYGVAMVLFGFTAKGVHLFCALYNLLNVAAVWLLASALGGSVAGILSALFFALFSGAPRLLARANAALVMLLPYVLSAYFFFRGLQNALPNRSFFLSGFFNILSILLNQVAYTNFLFLAVVLALCKDRPWKFRIKALTLISSGALAAAALIVAHFASERSLADFIHHAFLFGLRYSAGFDFNDALFRLFYMTGALLQEQSIVYLGAALFFLGHVPQEYRLQKKFVGLWMLTSFLGVSTGWAYLPHYFVQLLPALCVAAGLGFSI